ncbi:MAG: pantoate--beta-alanine ligase [Candidatus Margulisiibacteriota bacterium]
MKVISDPRKMHSFSISAAQKGLKIAFVPTMGALHEGHLALIRAAKKKLDVVVVSIFVNPIQFGPKEDLKKYPRNIKKDISLLKKEHVDVLFYPTAKNMFPEGYSSFVEVKGLDKNLCGASRPGHFRGVATIVAKLFNIVRPKVAFFGAKDYQQQAIIRKMVKDLNMSVEIVTVKTVRENDGLARSSRNAYLSKEERKQAPVLYKTLLLAAHMIKTGEKNAAKVAAAAKKSIVQDTEFKIDYVSVVNPQTLEYQKTIKRPVLIAVAAHLGKTRLIDNILI